MPKHCPFCGSVVGQRKIGKDTLAVASYCLNPDCFSVRKERIIHFVSKKAFNIEGLGEKIVEQLMEEGLLKDAGDIFYLKKEDLIGLERFAQKKADNLLLAIQKAKEIPLNRFLFALGIRHIGEENARLLAGFLAGKIKETPIDSSLVWRFFEELEREELIGILGLGEKGAKSIERFFRSVKNKSLCEKLLGAGVVVKMILGKNVQTQPLAGQRLVITGSFAGYSREQLKERIMALGGKVSGSVSTNTDYVLAGEKPGSKIKKAQSLGVKIVNQTEAMKLLEL